MVKTSKSTAIALILPFLLCSSASSKPLGERGQELTWSRCDPIGRVSSEGSRDFPVKSFVCPGDRPQSNDEARVEVFCFLNGHEFSLSNFASKCVRRETRAERFCNLRDRSNCPGSRKGPVSDNTPALIRPYGNTLMDGRPLFSWRKITRATSYKLEVTRGKDIVWQKKVVGTTLAYPIDQPPLQFGKVYKIIIIAKQGDLAINASNWSVNVLPESDVTEITKTADQLNHLDLSKDEKAYLDLDKLYMGWGLLGETIETLEGRIKAGSQNPKIYQTLGDRYLQAGLPDYAKAKYEAAARLAQKNNNLVELARAKASLKLITH